MATINCADGVQVTVAATLAGAALPSSAQEMASFATTTEVKLTSDVRSRGVSDSFNRPGAKLGVQIAHESGLVGLAEFATVSKKQFFGGDGLGVTLAGGYRFGDPEGWHFGVGLATELFPGAQFEAPHGFDMATGTPTDWRRTKYDSAFALAEVGCEIVRVTAPSLSAARCLREIRARFSAAGFAHVPLVADIHFLPQTAMEAVEHVIEGDRQEAGRPSTLDP